MYIFLCVHLKFYRFECFACMYFQHNTHTHKKRVLDLLEVELWMVVICYMGARNQTQVLYRKTRPCKCQAISPALNVYVFNAVICNTENCIMR